MDVTSEKETDGTKGQRGILICAYPFSLEVVLKLLRADTRYGDEAEVRQMCGEGFDVAVPIALQREAHVGLARAHPDFPDENVGKNAFACAIGNLERLRVCVCGDRIEFHRPLAISSGGGGFFLIAEGYSDRATRSIPAPDGVGLFLLQHHVVADDGRELDFGVRNCGKH